MVRLSPEVVELQHPQEFGCLTGIPGRARGIMTMLLHIYVPNGSIKLKMVQIRSVVVDFHHSQEFGRLMGILGGPDETMTLPLHIYGPRRLHRPWDRANCSSYYRVSVPARICVPNVTSWQGAMGQWPCRYTSMGQDCSIEFAMARISPVVVKAQHMQAWWHHQMETFSALLALCAGNSPVTGEFKRPVMRSFDVFFDLYLNKGLSKQFLGCWFEMPSH